MKEILLIDNYDSFTYNLVQLIHESGVNHRLTIVFNDVPLASLRRDFDKVILSPGPGLPQESGLLMHYIHFFAGKTALLGICLGHQAIGLYYGATLKHLGHPSHGIQSRVKLLTKEDLFIGLPDQLSCGRYHSWGIDHNQIPECLEVTAVDEHKTIMAIRHKTDKSYGLQFHPESYMTQSGVLMIRNWLLQD